MGLSVLMVYRGETNTYKSNRNTMLENVEMFLSLYYLRAVLRIVMGKVAGN